MPENETSSIPIKYLSTNSNNAPLKSYLEKDLKILPVQAVDAYTMKPDVKGKINLPGSGSAKAYLKLLSNLPQTQVLGLFLFCSEGDNRCHAFIFADIIGQILKHSNSSGDFELNKNVSSGDSGDLQSVSLFKWNIPFSWRNLFGDEPPAEIF